MNKLLRLVAFAIVVLFAVVLVDYLVIRQIGIRVLPVGYLVLRGAFYVLGALTIGIAIAAYGKEREGFFRWDVSCHRVIVLLCAGPAAATVLGVLGRYSWLADLFAHFRAQYVVLLGAGALALVALRQKRWAGLVAAFALANALLVGPHYVPWPSASAEGGTVLRFVLANVNVRNVDSGTFLKFLDEVDADVILVEEVNKRWIRELAPLSEEYPHSVAAPHPRPFGIALYSRIPLSSKAVVNFVSDRFPSIVATLDVSGEEVLFVGTHALRPRDAASSMWRDRQLRAIAERTRDVGSHVIVMGDLNTTPWGHAFRDLVARSGLVDSSLGMGPQWSWPSLFWPMGIPIDHALVSEELHVVGRFIGPHIGSDHYPLVLDVAL